MSGLGFELESKQSKHGEFGEEQEGRMNKAREDPGESSPAPQHLHTQAERLKWGWND